MWHLSEVDQIQMYNFGGHSSVSEFFVFRPSNSRWYQLDVFTRRISTQSFGLPDDKPIPQDYDGDGKTDIALFRPSTNTWYHIDTGDRGFRSRTFGQTGEFPSTASAQPE